MNMWYNSASAYGSPGPSYSLWGAPPSYNVQTYGTLTYAFVPDGGFTVAFLGFALAGVEGLRRKLSKA